MQFLSKCCINKFHRLQGLFWIKRSFRKEKFLDLKTGTEKFISSNEVFFASKRDLLVWEMGAKPLPQEFYPTFRIKRGRGGRTVKNSR